MLFSKIVKNRPGYFINANVELVLCWITVFTQPAIEFSFVGLIIAKIASSQVAHINCGNCRTTLMYPYGAPSVKCAVCQYVTNAGVSIDEPSDF